jgi:hypothetical protein
MRWSSRSLALLKPETGRWPFVVNRYGLGSVPAPSARRRDIFGNSSMISTASSERWTTCARSFFAFARGIVYTPLSRGAISDHSMPPTSSRR